MGEDDRFAVSKPGVSQPFGSNYDVDEKFHQKTGTKNNSNIAFGNDERQYDNKDYGAFSGYAKAQ